MDWNEIVKKAPEQPKLFEFDLSTEELKILQILRDKESESIDLLALKMDISVSRLSGILLNLEFEGLVKSLPGKRYRLSM
jgi:DNA processing protein